MRIGLSITILLLLFVFSALAINVDLLLDNAEYLKHNQNYENALDVYNQILLIDHDNPAAIKGREDCQIMLEPIIPVQHLMVPAHHDDAEYMELLEQHEKAKTPWDKRRAEIALDRYAVSYTGDVYSKEREDIVEVAKEIIITNTNGIKSTYAQKEAYFRTKQELINLQEKAHQSWKGHGPTFLDEAIEMLNQKYAENNWLIPHYPPDKTMPDSSKTISKEEFKLIALKLIAQINILTKNYPQFYNFDENKNVNLNTESIEINYNNAIKYIPNPEYIKWKNKEDVPLYIKRKLNYGLIPEKLPAYVNKNSINVEILMLPYGQYQSLMQLWLPELWIGNYAVKLNLQGKNINKIEKDLIDYLRQLKSDFE